MAAAMRTARAGEGRGGRLRFAAAAPAPCHASTAISATPATRCRIACSKPRTGADIMGAPGPVACPKLAAGVARIGQDAAIVTALREHEGQVAIGEERGLVDRAPGRDGVALRRHHEHRHRDVLERDHAALDSEAARCDPVLEEDAAEAPDICGRSK